MKKSSDNNNHQPNTETLDEAALSLKINRETAKIDWQSIARFYAKGMVIWVDPKLDLVDIATAFSTDDKSKIQSLMQQGLIDKAHDLQAIMWQQRNATLWAVLVLPWLLVQEPEDDG